MGSNINILLKLQHAPTRDFWSHSDISLTFWQ